MQRRWIVTSFLPVYLSVRGKLGRITKSEILEQCPDISKITVERTLGELVKRGDVLKLSGGRYTAYTWNRDKE